MIFANLKRAAIVGLIFVALGDGPALAGMSCPGDKVVWVNTKSGIYHFQGERWFGKTHEGKFICEHAADAEGDRPTHNGQ
jgi:hypothetical protein